MPEEIRRGQEAFLAACGGKRGPVMELLRGMARDLHWVGWEDAVELGEFAP